MKVNIAESRTSVMHSEASERFDHAEALLGELAKDLNLAMASCDLSFPGYGKTPDPCVQFERSREEGIRVAVFCNSIKDTIDLVLVKERRVFGQYSRAEVEAKFLSKVVEPLQRTYGAEAVHVVK